jgi:NTP pyrophosphatase (non-canonical NTP hydrolase)
MKKPKAKKLSPHTDIGRLRLEIDELRSAVRNAENAQRAFALDKAKRADQLRALLQVVNLLLWVASREVGVNFRELDLE